MAVLSRNFRRVFLGEKTRKFLGSPSVSASAPSPPQPEVPNMSVLSGLASEPRTPLSSKARMKRLPKKNQNEKYRLKYLRLRRAAKATVFENAAVCDEIARLEEKFLKAKEERR